MFCKERKGGGEMKVFDDIVVLELLKNEYEADQKISRIIKPETVKDKEEGPGGERIPFHYFSVVAKGPKCVKVEVGDRVFPKPPTLYNPGGLKGIVLWVNGKKESRFVIREEDIAGVE